MRIYKYTLQTIGEQTIPMPSGAKLLSVQTQNDAPQVWALVDERNPVANRKFATYGTGHPMPDAPGEYLGTYQIHGGMLVMHVFEVSL